MIDNDQITALAREYAEEIVQDTDSYPELPICLLNEMRKEVAEDFEEKIRFLLRRFTLVEKSKVEAKHKEALAALESNDNEDVKWGTYRLSLLESLFPDLGKEVEG